MCAQRLARHPRARPAACLASLHPARHRRRAHRHCCAPRGPRCSTPRASEILDLISSWWTCTHGHSHPEAQRGAGATGGAVRACDVRGLHASAGRRPCRAPGAASARRSHPRVLLRRRLDLGRSRAQDRLSILGQSRRAAARLLLAFDGGYHGDTLGAMSVGRGSQMFSPFRDLMCEVCVLPFPYDLRGRRGGGGARGRRAVRASRRCSPIADRRSPR